ncbi:recombinase family protein [Candidatus Daviesbacteria bacterium]|nr:recombinase family protein [Candidatus Daviesbacteria bacterium]
MDTSCTIESKMENVKIEECIVINRISSQRQDEGYSLPQQSKLNHEVVEKDCRKVVKEFNIIESAKSSDKRDDFYEAVDYIKKHHNIKYIYIEKTDRLTRNLKDTVLAYDLVNNFDVSFVFTRDNFILNKQSNSHAKFQFDIKAVLAKNYIDNLSDEVKKGQRGMLEEGKWPGGATPTGYKKIDKLLVPDIPRDSYVVRAF